MTKFEFVQQKSLKTFTVIMSTDEGITEIKLSLSNQWKMMFINEPTAAQCHFSV